MRLQAFFPLLALIAAGGLQARAQGVPHDYHFCVASSQAAREIYYSDAFRLYSDQGVRSQWKQHLLLHHPGADDASLDCSQGADSREGALANRAIALNNIRHRAMGLHTVDTQWTPGY